MGSRHITNTTVSAFKRKELSAVLIVFKENSSLNKVYTEQKFANTYKCSKLCA